MVWVGWEMESAGFLKMPFLHEVLLGYCHVFFAINVGRLKQRSSSNHLHCQAVVVFDKEAAVIAKGLSEKVDVNLSRLRTPSILHLLRWGVVADFGIRYD